MKTSGTKSQTYVKKSQTSDKLVNKSEKKSQTSHKM